MNPASSAHGAMRRFLMDEEKRHHGMQMACAIVLAYVASRLVGLPEQFWAVMSTLIVMRPSSGGTFDAGWDRARATVVGVLGGLLGVWLQQIGVNVIASTLAIVALLSFASAASPALRSAPIAALIILAAGKLAGHSALQVAVLRVVQMAIGIGVAMGVALASSRYRAPDRFCKGCATLLQRMARQLQLSGARGQTSEADAERAAAALRNALDRLSMLAGSADRELRLFRRKGPAANERVHQRLAGLVRRVVQDTSVLNRVLREQPAPDIAKAASSALLAVANALTGQAQPDLDELQAISASAQVDPLLAGPLHLLLDDLQRLAGLSAKLTAA
ncbi:FUSC family protein [Variovorax sp. J2P1-59]|uniref:FUSC family protein n=1 Tax=Variovorax flavidus TaxID=3053501 RepID=UPI0025785124|nr:FUSC family protein [Variovorax sp. J2P1-59]MDM0073824.1 FUSC family protein [Variovorax sp. J2P1-59]